MLFTYHTMIMLDMMAAIIRLLEFHFTLPSTKTSSNISCLAHDGLIVSFFRVPFPAYIKYYYTSNIFSISWDAAQQFSCGKTFARHARM